MRARADHTPRAGYSLVEVAVAVTIFSLIAGALSFVGTSSDRAYKTGFTTSNLESQTVLALERLVTELKIAGRDTLTPDPAPTVGTDSVDYVHVVDFVNGQAVTTPLRRLAFEYETGEVDDGADNNRNGLVDEGCVVLRQDVGLATERRIVLTRWVSELMQGEIANGLDDNGNGLTDERGFCLEWSAGTTSESLIVRLSLHRRDAQNRMLWRTSETSVRIRNSVD